MDANAEPNALAMASPGAAPISSAPEANAAGAEEDEDEDEAAAVATSDVETWADAACADGGRVVAAFVVKGRSAVG